MIEASGKPSGGCDIVTVGNQSGVSECDSVSATNAGSEEISELEGNATNATE